MTKIVTTLITYAIMLGFLGILPRVTLLLGKEALNAHQEGLVSLRALNRSLVGR